MSKDGLCVIVTGSASGLGAATAAILAKAGARIVVNYSNSKADAEATADKCRDAGAEVVVVQGDVARDEAAPNEAAPGEAAPGAVLVFFQHDEVIVHCPEAMAGAVADAVGSAAAEAGQLVFGPTPVRFPVTTAVVTSYADAK